MYTRIAQHFVQTLSKALFVTTTIESNSNSWTLTAIGQTAGVSSAIQVLGDSTGDGANEWPQIVAQRIADDNSYLTVVMRKFYATTQEYQAPVVLQTGSSGERFLDFSTGTYGRVMPIEESQHLAGVIDIRVKMRMSDWTPAVDNTILGKSEGVDSHGWYVFINTSGQLSFAYSVDGSNVISMNVATATGFADGQDGWCRWVWTPDTGGGNKTLSTYKSIDGVTWTQLGITTTSAGAVVLFNNATTPYSCGGTYGESAPPQVLRIYEVEIRDGLNGPIMAPLLPDLWSQFSSASAYSIGAPILTIVNGSVSGAALSYLSNANIVKKMTPDFGQEVSFLSCSHNDGLLYGGDYTSAYRAWIAAIKARLPGSAIVALTQNPQTDAAPYHAAHAARRPNIIAAAKSTGSDAIDIAASFLAVVAWESSLMTDNVHPNSSGQSLWADRVEQLLYAHST